MRTTVVPVGVALAVLWFLPGVAAAQSPTEFLYEGYLTQNGSPVEGSASFVFTLYSDPNDGSPLGLPLSEPNVPVRAGVFSVKLDFGSSALSGAVTWLEIQVTLSGGQRETLEPRQGLPALPYAFATPAPNVISGFSENGLEADVDAIGVTIAGGGGLFSGPDPDYVPDPNEPGDPNAPIIGPFAAPNIVTADFATIGGGAGNMAGGEATGLRGSGSGTGSTIGGGSGNTASGQYSTVGGGYYNSASGSYSTVAGGRSNTNASYAGAVGGGYLNEVFTGSYGTIAGGYGNKIGSASRSTYRSAILGGSGNRVLRDDSVILGGKDNLIDPPTGQYMSMAFGQNVAVKTGWQICFFENSYYGRLAINRDSDDGLSAARIIQVGKNTNNGNGAYLTQNGFWMTGTGTKDGAKSESLDGKDVLSRVATLPVQAQECKDNGERHIGPFAEDFHALFDVGPLNEDGTRDTEGLAAMDVAGVAVAAAQQLIKENQELRQRVEELEQRMADLEQQLSSGVSSPIGGRP